MSGMMIMVIIPDVTCDLELRSCAFCLWMMTSGVLYTAIHKMIGQNAEEHRRIEVTGKGPAQMARRPVCGRCIPAFQPQDWCRRNVNNRRRRTGQPCQSPQTWPAHTGSSINQHSGVAISHCIKLVAPPRTESVCCQYSFCCDKSTGSTH